MDLDALALVVDDRLHSPAAERGLGRLYAVRCNLGVPSGAVAATSGDRCLSVSNGRITVLADGTILELLAEGEARSLPQKVRPPAGLDAIALTSGVWVAPLDDCATLRPSQHPDRRRAHVTTLIACEGDCDAVDVSVLRYGDGAPTVMRGGMGIVHQLVLRCWGRRPEAPWATGSARAAAS